MIPTVIFVMIILGSLLMVYNIIGFVRFARRIKNLKNWGGRNKILNIPIVLLVLFLIGYLAVGFFGDPDLIVAGILFGGSIFVYVMYRMLSGITDRILENEKIEAKLMAAEEVSRAKSAFLASMSHEMRTPMNVILGLNALALKEPDLPARTRQQLEKIENSGKYLLELINNILELNNFDDDGRKSVQEAFSLTELLDQVNAIAQTLCEEKGLGYHYEAVGTLPACCEGDEMQIKKVLLGLLDNAVKYTDVPGTVSFTVNCTPDGEKKGNLRFRVSDTGIGMSEEFIPKIFEPFTKENSSSTNRFGGGGLSLAVAKNTVDLMGGTLEVNSRKGSGSAFTLTLSLPVADCPHQTIQTPEELISLAGCRVLVAEDVPENAEIVQDLLELEDVASDHAENGLIALETFESSPPDTYDAILMDLRMPVMDGLEATRRIRALPRPDALTIPIIALTANAFQSDMDAAQSAGMNEHLAKPADADTLYAALRKWITISRRQKGKLSCD